MSRPNWQVFLARELAARAGNTDHDHVVGALIVRGLVARNPQVDVAMQSFPQTDQTTQAAWSGAEKPAVLESALLQLWNTLDVPTARGVTVSAKRVANALWQRAMVEYLALPPQEHEAVAEIATRSKALGWYDTTAIKDESGQVSESYTWTDENDLQGGWCSGSHCVDFEGLRGSGKPRGLAGLGNLRDDILTVTPAGASRDAVMDSYNTLAGSRTLLKQYVKEWQAWAQGFGYYTGTIDGVWGPMSETAYLMMRREAYNRTTTFADLVTLTSLGGEGPVFVAQIAAGIARDKWIATRPSNYPEPASADNWGAGWVERDNEDGEPTRFEITLPEQGEPITSATVTITPVDNPEAEPVRVEITLPTGTTSGEQVVITPIEEGVDDQKPAWPGVLAVVGGLGLLGAVVLVTRKKS